MVSEALQRAVAAVDRELAADLEMTTMFDQTRQAVVLESLTRFTRWVNYLGLPALAVPCGFTPSRMPVGFQLIGRPFSERRLFRIGHAYQQATPWHVAAPDFQ